MKLLLDQGLPRSTASHLVRAGIHAEHVGELGHALASDAEILAMARQRGSTVVTLDADFHQLLALSGASSPSVIRVRIEGLRGKQLAEILQQVLGAIEQELQTGAVVSVTEHRVRLRRLPIS